MKARKDKRISWIERLQNVHTCIMFQRPDDMSIGTRDEERHGLGICHVIPIDECPPFSVLYGWYDSKIRRKCSLTVLENKVDEHISPPAVDICIIDVNFCLQANFGGVARTYSGIGCKRYPSYKSL